MSGAGSTSAPGLYIHIPFCRKKCGYCDFYSITETDLISSFLEALFREIDGYRGEFTGFDTIYFGGGTPSLLSIHQLGTLLENIHATFTILPDPEITIEINPADWGREELSMARGLGFNRISIGIQSFHDRELELLGRRHTAIQAVRALDDACGAGFDNISIDLMYGLPGQTLDAWQSNLGKALRLLPAHLSCYELEIKDGTPFGRRYGRGEFFRQTGETLREFFMLTSRTLEESGYIHYEVSNYARGMNRASRHNRKYWDHTPYLGLGPSAHSYRDRMRWWNHESFGDYLRDLEEGKRPVRDSEALDSSQLRMEALFLGLRTRAGIHLETFRLRYGTDLLAEKGALLAEWRSAGLIEIRDGFIRPTLSGMAVADSLALL